MKTCNTTTAGVANSAPASDPITYCQTKTSVWIRVGGEAFTTLKRIADVLNKWDGENHTPADILRLYGVGPILDGITGERKECAQTLAGMIVDLYDDSPDHRKLEAAFMAAGVRVSR